MGTSVWPAFKLKCKRSTGTYVEEEEEEELFYYIFVHNTVITDLAPQVAEANRGGPGKIKINEIC